MGGISADGKVGYWGVVKAFGQAVESVDELAESMVSVKGVESAGMWDGEMGDAKVDEWDNEMAGWMVVESAEERDGSQAVETAGQQDGRWDERMAELWVHLTVRM